MAETSKFPEWVIQIGERCRRTNAVGLSRATTELPPLTIFHREEDYESVYKPWRISLGPSSADWGDDWPKEESLPYFLKRYYIQVEQCYDVLKEVVDELRSAYGGLDQRWRDDTESFLRMMLVDGCFLLELMSSIRSHEYNPVIRDIVGNEQERMCYLHDIMLLENQLPLKLLNIVYMQPWFYIDLEDGPMNTFETRNRFTGHEFKGSLYLLDVYRKSLLQSKRRKRTKTRRFYGTNIPSATELHRVGFGITTSESTCLLDIQFRRNTLMLPEIVVDTSTKSTFLNFIAFEQHGSRNEITSYMYFMGCLIQTAEDVNLLKLRGIIATTLPPGEVADLFHRMSRNNSLDRMAAEIIEMLTMVRAEYNKMLNEWQKDLYQKCLKSPWATMSAMAAILLFTLSIIQTIYTVLSYVNRK